MDTQEHAPAAGRQSKAQFRARGLANLLRMGHCAPTVMQTLMDVSRLDEEWLVKFSAGMPGGIGNTGSECGALTSSLALLGLNYGLRESDRGLPVIFDRGDGLCRRFLECHRTMLCTEIRGDDRFPRHCIRPVLLAPELFVEALEGNGRIAIDEGIRESHRAIYSHMAGNDFHCAQAVFEQLQDTLPDHPELFDVVSGFMGGTLFMGLTCSAFTAGVMAIGLKSGQVEDSPLRVLRMLMIMTAGGNAFDESLNKFNRSMNLGYRLSRWFKREFGSTQCREITQCDFSSPSGVAKYIDGDYITRCRAITVKVAERVQKILAPLTSSGHTPRSVPAPV